MCLVYKPVVAKIRQGSIYTYGATIAGVFQSAQEVPFNLHQAERMFGNLNGSVCYTLEEALAQASKKLEALLPIIIMEGDQVERSPRVVIIDFDQKTVTG